MNYDEKRLKKLRRSLGKYKPIEKKEKMCNKYKIKSIRINKPIKLSRKTKIKQKLSKILRGPEGKSKERLSNLRLGIINVFKGNY